ncbi:hypothetical protein AAVH_18620 [Aphelenchoides avenae]|nr:hypothetical protein AAVH_18620 [Aphelenchus avenae]
MIEVNKTLHSPTDDVPGRDIAANMANVYAKTIGLLDLFYIMTTKAPSKKSQLTEADYKEYQPKITSAVIEFVDVLAKTAEELPLPFGDAKCGFLPDDGLPKGDLLPRLSKTLKPLMGLMRAILDEMIEGNYKFRNSTSLSGIVRVCTEYGVKPSANYFAVGLDATVPDAIARGCDSKNASLK